MAYKSSYTTYLSDWSKTLAWAKSEGIPNTSVGPVYALDTQRLASGDDIMSQAERTRAILSAANMQTNTVLPTDLRTPSNVLVNAYSDLSNIFTGLTGFLTGHSEANMWDAFKDAITDPTGKNIENLAAQWIPGVQDIEEYQQGGISDVLDHPIISLLDVLPLGNTALRLAAKAGFADRIADAAGTTADALAAAPSHGGIGLLRATGRIVSRTQLEGGMISRIPGVGQVAGMLTGAGGPLVRDATTGELTQVNATIGSRVRDLFKNAPGKAHLYKEALEINQKMTDLNKQLASPFHVMMGKLTGDEPAEVNRLLTQSGMTPAQIAEDDSISVGVKNAIAAYLPLKNWMQEKLLATGEAQWLTLPDGSKEFYLSKDAPVTASTVVEKADAALAKKAQAADALALQIVRLDAQAAPYADHLSQVGQAIYQRIRGDEERLNQRVPGRAQIERRQMGQILRTDAVTQRQVSSLDALLSPGGLVDQMKSAFNDGDFDTYKKLVTQAERRFHTQALNPLQSPDITDLANTFNELKQYAQYRSKLEKQYLREYTKNVESAMAKAAKAHEDFEKAVLRHPPARYIPMYLEVFANSLRAHLDGANKTDAALQVLRKSGVPESELARAQTDPRVLAESISLASRALGNDPFVGILDKKDIIQVENSAFDEIARTRAMGFQQAKLTVKGHPLTEQDFGPTYVPSVTSHELGRASYNVHMQLETIPSVDAAKARLFDYTNTVSDINVAVSKAMLQQLTRDGIIEFHTDYMPQHIYNGDDLYHLAQTQGLLKGFDPRSASGIAQLERIYETHFGLVQYNPESLFGYGAPKITPGAQYIPANIRDAITSFVKRDQLPVHGAVQTATSIFRTSVLAFSPRFTAHILFGGSFLVGLRGYPSMVQFMSDSYKLASAISKNDLDSVSSIIEKQIGPGVNLDNVLVGLRHRMAQAGNEDEIIQYVDQAFHHAGGKQIGNLLLHEMMDRDGLDKSKLSSWATAAANINYRLTSHIVLMQRALVYLDGASRVAKYAGRHEGQILDEAGHKVTLTTERASFEGIKAANRVMGDLREMTPFERHVMTTVMPFYGWTKHVLRYVASYPVDHPYRAQFLSNLANMNSEQVPSGLPTRIQLLFFLGSPSPDGTITTDDVRALNPLRDTANYMTLSGIVSALNPVFTGFMQAIDPQATYGGVPLYPNLTYSDLYGARGATAPGSRALDVIESFIPQVGALDVALDLSGQYKNLRQTDPGEYINDITTALGIPFTPETINLRQMAAKNEISKYQVAEQLANHAWDTGDFSQIMDLPSVPDPLNTLYNITPTQLLALYNYYKGQAPADVAPSEVAPPLPTPSSL